MSRAHGAGVRRHGPVLVGFAVLTCLTLWPAVVHFRTQALIGTRDSSVFYWSWWFMPRAAWSGRNPYETLQIFHPVGADLALTTTSPLVGFVTYPIRVWLGPVAQVNLVQLVATWMALACAYLLLDRMCRVRSAAIVGAIGFAFAPYRFVHLPDHLNLVHTGFLPLCVLLLLRYLDEPTRKRAVTIGVTLGCAFLVDPQIALLSVTCMAPVAALRRRDLARAWRPLLTGAGVALAVSGPLLVPMAFAVRAGEGARPDLTLMILYSARPLRWVQPPFSSWAFEGLSDGFTGAASDEGVAYPGIVALVGAVIAVRYLGRAVRPWMLMLAIGFVLALGPYLSYGDRYLPIPLPYAATALVPGLSSLRVPGRFTIVGTLALAVLAAQGIAEMQRRWPRRRPLMLVVLAVVLAVDLWPARLPTRGDEVPRPYEVIASDPAQGAVLDVPLQWSTGQKIIGDQQHHHPIFMTYATRHGRPMVGGSVSRYPADRLEQLLATGVYRQVLSLQDEPGFDDLAIFGAEELRRLGIDFVVYHRDRPQPAALAYLESLRLPVLADDGIVVVWKVPEGG